MARPKRLKPLVKILAHQYDFIHTLSPTFIGLVGGYRSGKTWALCEKAIKLARLNLPQSGALLEPIQAMIRRVLVPTFKQVLFAHKLKYKHVKSNPESFILHFPEGDATIYLLGAENYDRINGMTLAWFGIDELDKIKLDVAEAAWAQCVSRLTNGRCVQGFTTSTPEGYNFLHKFFVVGGANPDRKLIRASTRDNPYIRDDYIKNMEATHDGKQLQAYLDGYFVNLTTGNVYYNFDRLIHCRPETPQLGGYRPIEYFTNPQQIFHIGMDFNAGNCNAIIAVVDKGIVYGVGEIAGAQHTPHMIELIKAKLPGRQIIIYPDCAGGQANANASKSSLAQLKEAGFALKYHKAHPRILDSVAAVNAKMKNSKGVIGVYIDPEACPEWVKGLEQQGFGTDGNPDKSSGLDHMLDGARYFFEFNFALTTAGTYKVY